MYIYRAPDDGHNDARNMLSKQLVLQYKTNLLHLVDHLFPRINDDARSNSHRVYITSQLTVIFIITTRVTSNFTTISLQICTNILRYKTTILLPSSEPM
jgi:hypothetical protein